MENLLYLGVPILKNFLSILICQDEVQEELLHYPGICVCIGLGIGVSISKMLKLLPYFFDYKTEFFSFQNNPKDLDPSC